MKEWSRLTRAAIRAAVIVSLVFTVVCRASAVSHDPPVPVLEDAGPSLEQVLARYVEASGGEEAFSRLTSRVMRGHVVTDLLTWEPPVYEVDTLSVWSRGDGAFLVTHRTARGVELEGFDGVDAWKREVEGKAFAVHAADRSNAWLTDLRFPVRLSGLYPEMVYMGVTLLDGRRYDVVDVDCRHLHRLYFDESTGLLSRVGYNSTILRYAEVDGVLVPVEVEYSRKGGSSTVLIDSVLHNVPIDERAFSMPGAY